MKFTKKEKVEEPTYTAAAPTTEVKIEKKDYYTKEEVDLLLKEQRIRLRSFFLESLEPIKADLEKLTGITEKVDEMYEPIKAQHKAAAEERLKQWSEEHEEEEENYGL